jgi:Holliday junction DNA helicase RuvB
MDHVIVHGPPGLGKTTLAHAIAHAMGVQCRPTSGPILTKPGDLAALLTHLSPGDVLFIDEIHRLTTAVEEILYSAMEDRVIDIMIGEGPTARSVRVDLPPFTLVGATTRLGLLSNPLRDRFGIPLRMRFYFPEELRLILAQAAGSVGIDGEGEAWQSIASRSRGTPRIALRLLRRVADFALAWGADRITALVAEQALDRLEVDRRGLDSNDRRYLRFLADHCRGGPVGLESLAAALAEDRATLEDSVEPYLLQQGFVLRTPRGRVLTALSFEHLGVKPDPHWEALAVGDVMQDIDEDATPC